MVSERSFHSKIVLCGDIGVGKTSIRRNFMGLSFVEDHVSTLGADFSLKKVPVNNDRLDMQIWDLGGQRRYKQLRKRYFAGARGALMVFDLTVRSSFDNLHYWFDEFWTHARSKELPVVILGNKCDLTNFKVEDQEVHELIDKIKTTNDISDIFYSYFQTSAKDGINIDKSFKNLAHAIHHNLLDELGLQQ